MGVVGLGQMQARMRDSREQSQNRENTNN